MLFACMWRHVGNTDAAQAGAAPAALPNALPSGPAWPLVAMYGLLGFAYMIPASFLPLIAERQLHMPALREWFWPLFGLATTLSTLALRWLPARVDNRTVLAACAVSMMAGMLLCIVGHGVAALLLATVLIGSACMPVVMYTMREARLLAPHNHVRLVAALTATFGVGQAAGPVFAAWLTARSGSFDAALAVGAGVAFAAMACMLVRARVSGTVSGAMQRQVAGEHRQELSPTPRQGTSKNYPLIRHSCESRTVEAGCRNEHWRSQWPEGQAAGAGCHPVSLAPKA